MGVLDGEDNAARAIVIANAGAALYVAGEAATVRQGVEMAADVIRSGAARQKLEDLISVSKEAGS